MLVWICFGFTTCKPLAYIESVYIYNDTLYQQYEKDTHRFPISFVVDTIRNNRTIYYIHSDSSIDTICSLNRNMIDEQDYISCINRIAVHRNVYYQFIFSEDVVGTDFFILFDVHSGKTYISHKYNFQAEQYNFDIQTLDIKDRSIDVVYTVTKCRETIYFSIYANGELTSIVQPFQDNFRRHLWNEAGQLAYFVSNEYCGYYAYDAQGNRAYKQTGTVVADQYDAGTMQATAYFDDATLYVNPYMVVTPRGYTKHYYNGSQRIASRLGDYWELEDPSVDAEDELAIADSLWLHTTTIIEPSHQDMEGDYQYIQADGSNLPIVSYGPYISSIRGFHAEDILWGVFGGHSHEDDGGMTDDGVFYYHPDHLGSATWITSDRGQVVQYLHYMPFGELWESQQASEYDERFKFTGKERDTETGYDYFGARYYLSLHGNRIKITTSIV